MMRDGMSCPAQLPVVEVFFTLKQVFSGWWIFFCGFLFVLLVVLDGVGFLVGFLVGWVFCFLFLCVWFCCCF